MDRKATYVCSACNFSTHHRGHWKEHQMTKKHLRAARTHVCSNCGRAYKHRQSLHKHRGTCDKKSQADNAPEAEETSQSDLMRVIEQLIPRVNQTTNNINVQILLNKECADAMTIQSFATNLHMSLEDICAQKTTGKPDMMSRIMSHNLGPIRVQDRPIHRAEGATSRWLVHDETDGWREDSGTSVFRAASFGITRRFQELWDAAHPNWKSDDDLRTAWIDIVACLNADPTEKEVREMLDRLGPHCRLTAEELRQALQIERAQ